MLGVDASLTRTGLSWRQRGVVTRTVPTDELRGAHRLFYIRKEFKEAISDSGATLVAIEGYAMGFGGRNPGRVFDLGELGGVLKLTAWEIGLDVLIVSPSTMKMLMTGSGTTKKEQVAPIIRRVWGQELYQSDEADAFGIMTVGELFLGLTVGKFGSKKYLNALESCQLIPGQLKLTSKMA